jgi:hypothetical protein
MTYLRIDIGLQLKEFLLVDDPQSLHSIRLSSFFQLLEMCLFFLARRNDETSVLLVSEMKVVVEGRKHLVPRPAEFRAIRTRCVVEPGVNDAAVPFGCTLGDVISGCVGGGVSGGWCGSVEEVRGG